MRSEPLPDALPDRSPDTVDAQPRSPAVNTRSPSQPNRNRFPSRLGGERGVIGERIQTRSRTGAAFLVQRGPLTSRFIRPGTGCLRKVSSTSLDPRSRKEAIAENEEMWSGAESKEIHNHEENQSWKYIPRSAVLAGRRLVRLI